jgi:DNA-binding transcriptional MerR regulator
VNRAGQPLRAAKSATAFRTIGEVAQELDLPTHVLRFWETKFSELRPLKRGGGRRYYRPEDVDLLRRIRQYLYQEGYTIRGVQKLLREGRSRADEASRESKPRPKPRAQGSVNPSGEVAARPDIAWMKLQKTLRELRTELLEIRALLGKLLEG